MEITPLNSVRFYTVDQARVSEESKRAEHFRLRLEKALSGNSAASESIAEMAAERKASAASDYYFSTLRPHLSRQAPVSEQENASRLYYRIRKNPAGNYAFSPSFESEKTNQNNTEERFSADAAKDSGEGFVYTITDEHMERLKEYSGSKARNPIYMRFNSASEEFKGSLVNLVF